MSNGCGRILALLLVAALGPRTAMLHAQGSASPPSAGVTVQLDPPTTRAEPGQQLTFTAVARDASGKPLPDRPALWFAIPADLAAADSNGTVFIYAPGSVQVGALVAGQIGFASVEVAPGRVARIDIDPLPSSLVVGGTARLSATPRSQNGDPRNDVVPAWRSSALAVATVDGGGLVTGVAPGRATLTADAEGGSGTVEVTVVENPVRSLSITPGSATGRTGEVIHFSPRALGAEGAALDKAFVGWTVDGEGATVFPDGAFVADRPGTYAVTATSGDRVATASVIVTPRNVRRDLEVIGRIPVHDFEAAEQWIFGKTAYLSGLDDRVWAFDISDPANPVKTDSLVVDARFVNDVSVSADGKIGVLTREGASSRKNGIVFFDASDPLHPKVLSEFTETVTGGVHSAFIDGHYVYLTDDATGSLRVIDFSDVQHPKQVARWQVESPVYRKTDSPDGGAFSSGRYLHDVYVKDGLIYLAYWRDGLVILDVGKGIKGGSPENPQVVSQLRFNHNELYGPDWLAGTHTVFRYKDYLFVGDEVFPKDWGLNPSYEKGRIPTRGILHVVDVSDIEHPRKVAWYAVPEAGAHNVWVLDDVLVMGYYAGGGRVLDVSGELRGDLFAQGREIAHLWAGDPQGYVPNVPWTWGAQHHDGLIYFNDVNSGIWITKLGDARQLGSTTEPGT
jgi:hypothetical protein